MRNIILTCIDFEKAGIWDTKHCCSSCHGEESVDEAEPYPKKHSRVYAEVCCSFDDESLTRSDWAKTLNIKRKVFWLNPDEYEDEEDP